MQIWTCLLKEKESFIVHKIKSMVVIFYWFGIFLRQATPTIMVKIVIYQIKMKDILVAKHWQTFKGTVRYVSLNMYAHDPVNNFILLWSFWPWFTDHKFAPNQKTWHLLKIPAVPSVYRSTAFFWLCSKSRNKTTHCRARKHRCTWSKNAKFFSSENDAWNKSSKSSRSGCTSRRRSTGLYLHKKESWAHTLKYDASTILHSTLRLNVSCLKLKVVRIFVRLCSIPHKHAMYMGKFPLSSPAIHPTQLPHI